MAVEVNLQRLNRQMKYRGLRLLVYVCGNVSDQRATLFQD